MKDTFKRKGKSLITAYPLITNLKMITMNFILRTAFRTLILICLHFFKNYRRRT